jgi:NADPH-dependent curcumin reductase CurA
MVNRHIVLVSHAAGAPSAGNFELRDQPIPTVGEGQVLRRTIYLSIDPYMRGRMGTAKSYAPGVAIGQVMVGGTVSQVIESRNPDFARGDFVVGFDGWQEYQISSGRELRKLDPRAAPISTALGVLGMPGMTAYVGLLDIGQPKAGETVVVSAASGAVGSIVGQIARLKGCRVVGIAGAPEKCEYVQRELGFDACVSHRGTTLADDLRGACPRGIDVYFENVGGAVFGAVSRLINAHSRIAVCGVISEYNSTSAEGSGPTLRWILTNRVTMRGFIVSEHPDRFDDFWRDCSQWVSDGAIKYREDVIEGLESAPEALRRLFEGRNFGKLLVRVSPDPTQATGR